MSAAHRLHRISKGRLILIGVLAVSLLGNAVALGAVWRFQQVRVTLMGDEAGPPPAFPADIRRELRAHLQDNQDSLSPKVRAVIDARRDVVDTGTATPFDKAATEAAMEEFRRALDEAVREAQGLVLEVLEARASEQ
ncbi:MAG: hypothetical protein HWE33_03485 [Rhodobacteraceae bacterium]|nr:hypothetical protein [Paracoccaceae bacterium]